MRTRIVRCAALTASAICTATVMTSCALFERRMEHKVKTEVSFSWWGKDARNEYTLDGLKAYQNSNKDVVVRPEYALQESHFLTVHKIVKKLCGFLRGLGIFLYGINASGLFIPTTAHCLLMLWIVAYNDVKAKLLSRLAVILCV